MGACSMGFSAKISFTTAEVNKLFKENQECDASNHGSSYGGGFATVNRVVFKDKVFDNHEDADDFCLDHAEKWSTVIAVKVIANPDTVNQEPSDPNNYWWVAGWGAE